MPALPAWLLGLLFSRTSLLTMALMLMLRRFLGSVSPQFFFRSDCDRATRLASALRTVPFNITPWLRNGHLASILGSLLRQPPAVAYTREILQLDDGGEAALDWLGKDAAAATPTVIVLHGLTGDSQGNYIRQAVTLLHSSGFRVAVLNNRGCGGVPLRTAKGYSAAQTADLAHAVRHIRTSFPSCPLLAVGYSLGSMILVKYLGETGENCPFTAALSVSNPMNVHTATASLESFPSRQLYNRHLTDRLKDLIRANFAALRSDASPDASRDRAAAALPTGEADALIHWNRLASVGTIREFDALVIVPMFGYPHINAYYDDATSMNHLPAVRVPLLCLNAADDPFAPIAGIDFRIVEQNPHVMFLVTPHGGHVMFPTGWLPRRHSYADDVMLRFFRAALAEDPLSRRDSHATTGSAPVPGSPSTPDSRGIVARAPPLRHLEAADAVDLERYCTTPPLGLTAVLRPAQRTSTPRRLNSPAPHSPAPHSPAPPVLGDLS